MYALAINGSPRKESNTGILLAHVLEPLTNAGWETELVQIGGKGIHGCIACGMCRKNQDRRCAVKTDMFNDVYAKMLEADAIILGSPTYFADMTADMKAVVDRSGYVSLANGKLFTGKIGAAVAAERRGGAIHVFDSINHMFLMNHMIVPGSLYWNFGVGREPGEVSGDQEALANMRNLGQTIAWLGAAIKPHLASFPKLS